MIITKIYPEPPINEKQILRYCRSPYANEETVALMRECIKEAQKFLTYKVCYIELAAEIKEDICNFTSFSLHSKKLASNLNGCSRVIVFAATIGVEIDRLIRKYSSISPAKALLFQAIGAERVEALCDCFCNDIANEYNASLRRRYSPGYGDLALNAQKEIFSVLNCEKKIGLTLNNSMIMSPSKSVTAILGVEEV